MSLLTVIQQVCRETGWPAPSTVVGNSANHVVSLLALAHREGQYLAQYNWTGLQKEHTFTITATAAYELPTDFNHFINRTEWDRAASERIGRLSPQDWQLYKSDMITPVSDYLLRVKQDSDGQTRLFLHPEPGASATASAVFEYVSDGWVSATATATARFTADGNTVRFPEYLLELGTKWRWLRTLGRSWQDERTEYERAFERLLGQDGGARSLNFGGPSDRPYPNLPEGDFTI
jgi:hypothetical protein